MGLYDRDYSREEDEWGYSPTGHRPRSVQSMTILLIVINVVIYLVDQIASPDHRLMDTLALHPESVTRPWMWWQFLTAAFAHDPRGLNHIFGNMLGLFFFGRDLEAKLGRYEFLRFYLVSAVLGNVVWVLIRYLGTGPEIWGSLLGASGAVTAVIVLFICYFPRSTIYLMMILPIPAWLFGIVIIGQDMLGALQTPVPGEPRVANDVHLTGAAFAAAYWHFHWHLGTIMPLAWLGSVKKFFRRPKLKIHAPEPTYDNLDAEADRVLEKVHQEGEASLTPRERRVLEDYSRRMRQKLR